jgi:catechol 2,3-dioxygenase-like lactoylglutathione lyase family enzyme
MKAQINRQVLLGTTLLCLFAASSAVADPAGEVLAPGNFIHVVANLDKTIAFHHEVLGLQQANSGGAPRFAPNPAVAQLYAVPQTASVGVAVFRLPVQGVALEFAEFRDVPQGSSRPRPQDPGASVLVLTVRNLDVILQQVHAAKARVVTTGGKPVVHEDGGVTTRSIVVADPDGYYIELLEHNPQSDPGAAGNIVQAELMLSVADTDQSVHYYRDLVGLPLQIDRSFAPDATLSRALGVRRAQFRHSVAAIPGSDFKYDFVEWKGVVRHPTQPRIFDHGAGVLRLAVGNVDTFVSHLKADGISVASRGGEPVAMSAVFRACILGDPNGLFIQPSTRIQPQGK